MSPSQLKLDILSARSHWLRSFSLTPILNIGRGLRGRTGFHREGHSGPLARAIALFAGPQTRALNTAEVVKRTRV